MIGWAHSRITVHRLVDCLRCPQHGVRIGKRLRQIVDEREVRIADANDFAGLQMVVVLDALAVDKCAVAAIEIAERPVATGLKNFSMVAATAFVLDDNRVGRRAADGYGLAID